MRGACADSVFAGGGAHFAIWSRMWRRPALACCRALAMMSSVMPSTWFQLILNFGSDCKVKLVVDCCGFDGVSAGLSSVSSDCGCDGYSLPSATVTDPRHPDTPPPVAAPLPPTHPAWLSLFWADVYNPPPHPRTLMSIWKAVMASWSPAT